MTSLAHAGVAEKSSDLLAVRKAVSSDSPRLVRQVGIKPPANLSHLLPGLTVVDWPGENLPTADVVVHPSAGLLVVADDEIRLNALTAVIHRAADTGSPATFSLPTTERRELTGRIFAVTGAANGIGEAIAEVLASQGATLVLADLAEERLRTVAETLTQTHGVGVSWVVGDVSVADTNERIVSTAVDNFGGIDGIVVNAGIATAGEIVELDHDSWNRCMNVNLYSAFALTQETLRLMRTQELGGSLVYIASKNAFGPGHGFGAYSVSKAALIQLARITAIEGGEFGIRSNVVNPDSIFGGSKLWSPELRRQRALAHGVEESELEAHYAQRNLLKSTISGSDVGEAVAFLLSERSRRTTGCVITVDGGVSAAFPR